MSQSFQPTILRFDALASTNTEAARQAARGAPEGLCVVAREQTAGRGRLGRRWSSPKDAGLYVSLLLRPRLAPDAWPLLTLMAALAVTDALRAEYGVSVDIKWPNDIHDARGRKLAGILAEAVETATGRACVVGIGINLTAQAVPPELCEAAVSVSELTTRPPDAEALLRQLVRAFARRYAGLQAEGGAPATLDAWSARSSYAEGKRVRVIREQQQVVEGTTRGLEPDGALRIEIDAGEIEIVRAGDVTAIRRMDDKA